MKPSYNIIIGIFVTLLLISSNSQGRHLLIRTGAAHGGWTGFGTGFQDIAFDVDDQELVVHCDWDSATWGLAIMFSLDKQINGRKIKAIRAKVKTMNGSKTHFYTGMSTVDDATIELSRHKALELTDTWRIYELPVIEMESLQPEEGARIFDDGDWDRIRIVKLLFTKPKGTDIPKDVIVIRNPEIVFHRN